VGGLAAYQQQLAAALRSTAKYDVNMLAMLEPAPVRGLESNPSQLSVTMIPGQAALCLWKPVLSRLASRPCLLPVLRMLMSRIVSPSQLTAGLRKNEALHFVGTGWDYLGFPLLKAAKAANIRFTVWPAVHPSNWGDDKIDISLYREADAVFCQSDYEKHHLAKLGVPESKLVRCGLPPMCLENGDGPRLRSRLNLGDRPSVLFLGRRDVGKGYPALLDAWPLVLRQCPNAVLLLAGPGSIDEPRLSKIPSSNIRDLGCPSEQEKADAYAACDVFCLPSAHESFGIVYLEAWSYGKPVICGTAPASRELVEDGVTGVWADQQPQQLTASLLRLLTNTSLRQSIGGAGLMQQRSRYTDKHLVKCHLNAWQTVQFN
jgi:glycosyltransferase involved in cell wall biosynthesis